MSKHDELVALIRAYPVAYIQVDNDCWFMWSSKTDYQNDGPPIATSRTHGSIGNCYGGDVFCALAEIVGVTVEPC